MEGINLSKTSQEILSILFAEPERKFYVNELIRKTGRYPNSIQKSLESLEKQKILLSSRQGYRKFYSLNKSYKYFPEIEQLITKKKIGAKSSDLEWVKVVNRTTEIPYIYSLFIGQREYISKLLGFRYENFWYNGVTGGVYYFKKHLEDGGRVIAANVLKDKKYAKKMVEDCYGKGNKLIEQTNLILKKDLISMSKGEGYLLLSGIVDHFYSFAPFLFLPLSIETVLEKEIDETLKNLKLPDEVFQRAKEIITEPIDFVTEQQLRELELASLVKENGWNLKARNELAELTKDLCWLPMYSMFAKPFDENYFKGNIEQVLKKIKKPKQELNLLKIANNTKKKELDKFLVKIKSGSYLKDLVYLFQSYISLRFYRINIIRKFNYCILPLLNEISHRMDLEENEIKYLTYEEMLGWLRYGYGKKFGYSHDFLKKEINKRMSGFAVLMWKGNIKIVTGVEKIIETMERYRIVASTPAMGRVVKGSPACRGKVTGRVKVVRKLSELNKVENGDVLVAKMTTPDYMMAIHKAVAIVTDEGGITCHAAIVSREFNLPCIVGTKNATQVLSDGDIVEVDADSGVVRVVEDVEVDENIKEIFGKCAFKGKVKGPVRVVFDASDFPKVQEGDILVAPQTTPEYLSTLYKVKGFVVDEDSLTSHAMLYANALRLPSLIGTNFARNVLQDGETVELDATNGVLKRLQ